MHLQYLTRSKRSGRSFLLPDLDILETTYAFLQYDTYSERLIDHTIQTTRMNGSFFYDPQILYDPRSIFFRTVDQSKKSVRYVCMGHKPTRFLQAIYFISLTGWRNFTRKVYIVFGTDFSLQQIHRLPSYQGEFFLRNPCFLTKTMYREKKS